MANLLKLLKWKARHNDCDLDYVQIAKYLNVDNFGVNHVIFFIKPVKNAICLFIIYFNKIFFLHFSLENFLPMSTFLA